MLFRSAGSTLSLSGQSLGGTGKLTNAGTFNFDNSSIAGTLINQGTLNVNSGSSSVNGAVLDLAGGALNIAGGATLDKNTGAVNWGGGSIGGAGNLTTSGGATFGFAGAGSRVLNGPSLSPTNFDILAGSLDLQSGTLTISGGTLANGANLSLSGGSINTSGPLAVSGTMNLSSGSASGAGVIDVTGSITKTGPATFTIANPLNNNGNVTTQAGSLVLTGGGTHGGTFTAAAGSTIDFQGGSHNFADGTVLAGPGNFDGGGTLRLTGNATGLQFAAGTNINLNALAFGGSGKLTNLGTVGGSTLTLPGDFVNGVGATANLTNVGIGGSLFNYGNFTVGGTVTVAGLEGRQLGGVLSIPLNATLDMSNPSGVFTQVDGIINAQGTLSFSGGGTFAFAGTGDRVINGLNLAFTNLTVPNGSLTLQSGSLTLTGAAVLPAGVILNLTGGTLTNNGTLDVGGTFGLTGGAFGGTGSLSMSGGSLSLPAGNAVAWTNSGVLTNTGTLNLADSTITNAIDNQGIIFLEGGLTFTQTLTNTGTLNAQPGNAVFAGGLVQQPGGSIVLNDGSLQGNIDLNAGSLSGRGTVNGNLVIGNAMLAPGFSPGAITINGNLSLAGGSVLGVELGGVVQGTSYDWINVLGTANLAGTLNVSNVGGFVPAAGASFTIMNFASSTGAFAVVNLPLNINPAPAPTSFTLVVPVVAVNTVPPLPPLPPVPAAVVALRQADPSEPLSDGVKILAPLAQPEDKREIEVEGCR